MEAETQEVQGAGEGEKAPEVGSATTGGTAATGTTETGTAAAQTGTEAKGAEAGPETEHPKSIMARIREKIGDWDEDLHEELHEDLTAIEKLFGIGG